MARSIISLSCAPELAALGAVFVTKGDTEVLLHGWAIWGPAMLDQLNGMFAFALHDARRQCLFLRATGWA